MAVCGYVDVIRMLQADELDRVDFNPEMEGFDGVLVDASEVAAKAPKKELPGLTARQAAQRIGVVIEGDAPQCDLPPGRSGSRIRHRSGLRLT